MLIVNRLDGHLAARGSMDEAMVYTLLYMVPACLCPVGGSPGRGVSTKHFNIQHSNNQTLSELIIALVHKQQISLCAFH
jgi:hypothetical protein